MQPVDVSLNKPLKSVLRKSWIEYVHSQVDSHSGPIDKLVPPTKLLVTEWLKCGLDYLKEHSDIVKKSVGLPMH